MYDSFIYCAEYRELKEYIGDILCGAVTDYDLEELTGHIQDLYDTGKMSSSQYDDLMCLIQDI